MKKKLTKRWDERFLKVLLIITSFCFVLVNTAGLNSWAEGPGITTGPIFTDVTPACFSVVWTVNEPATCTVEVYEDAGGLNQVTCSVVAENTVHPPAEDMGVMKVLVSGLPAGIQTFYVITKTTSKSSAEVTDYPASVPLLEVTLEDQYLPLVTNDNIYQYLYDEAENPVEGAMLVAEVEGGDYPITGWTTSSGRAIIYMCGFYSASIHKTLELYGGEQLTLRGWGGILGESETIQPVPTNTGLGSYLAADPREATIMPPSPLPYISSVSPHIVKSGDSVTINGENFGASRETSQVFFESTSAANYPSWSDTQIQVDLPEISPNTYADVDVKVVVGTQESNTVQISLDNQKPTVTINNPTDNAQININEVSVVPISGTATDQGSSVESAEVKINSGGWLAATGTTAWNYEWDISGLPVGEYSIFARAIDSLGNISLEDSHTLHLDTSQDPPCQIRSIKVSNNSGRSVTISWFTNTDSSGEIRYSEDENFTTYTTVQDERGEEYRGTSHYVKITSLNPETTYYFEVQSEDTIDNNNGAYYSFTTCTESMPQIPRVLFGKVYQNDGVSFAEGAVVYITIISGTNHSYLLSGLVGSNGRWEIGLRNPLNAPDCTQFNWMAGDTIKIEADCGCLMLAYGQAEISGGSDPQNCGDLVCQPHIPYSLQLEAGYNLISLPLDPLIEHQTGQEIAFDSYSLIAYIDGCKMITDWDPTSYWYDIAYKDDTGEIFGDLFDILPGGAYFILVEAALEVTFYGKIAESPHTLELTDGYNFISLIYGPDMPAEPSTGYTSHTLLTDLTGGSMIADWDPTSYWYDIAYIDIDEPFGDQFDISVGKGYIVLVDGDSSWTPQVSPTGLLGRYKPGEPIMRNSLSWPGVDPDISDLTVSNNSGRSVTVSWFTNTDSSGEVHYSEDQNFSAYTIVQDERGEEYCGTSHYVKITSLNPETTYYFEIQSEDTIDNDDGVFHSFTTCTAPIPQVPRGLFGRVYLSDGVTPAEGAVAYITIINGANQSYALSSLVESNAIWTVELRNPINAPDCTQFYWNVGDEISIEVRNGVGLNNEEMGGCVIESDHPQDCGVLTIPPPEYYHYYRDFDEDTFGDPNNEVEMQDTVPPSGYVTNNLDCDDEVGTINPEAPELCDGIDNDCDEGIDEGFDLQTDPDNCGACGYECQYDYAEDLCVGGECFMGTCEAGYHDINNDSIDGCEYECTETNEGVEICDGVDNDCDEGIDEDFDLNTDKNNCGFCGHICPSYPHADTLCIESQCVMGSCEANWQDVDGDPANGCEQQQLEIDVEINLTAGWSMISLPVDPANKQIKTLFAEAEAVFEFTTKYVLLDPNDPMEIGKGYWIYLPGDKIYHIKGMPIDYYEISNAPSGWSMIGSCSYPAIPSVDNGAIRAVFGFEDKYVLYGSGDTINLLGPGNGFWINLSEGANLLVEGE